MSHRGAPPRRADPTRRRPSAVRSGARPAAAGRLRRGPGTAIRRAGRCVAHAPRTGPAARGSATASTGTATLRSAVGAQPTVPALRLRLRARSRPEPHRAKTYIAWRVTKRRPVRRARKSATPGCPVLSAVSRGAHGRAPYLASALMRSRGGAVLSTPPRADALRAKPCRYSVLRLHHRLARAGFSSASAAAAAASSERALAQPQRTIASGGVQALTDFAFRFFCM